MINPLIRILMPVLIMLPFINCSLDGASVLKHPDAANPSTQITVELLNSYVRLEQSGIVSAPITRDNIHIGFGLPAADWSVVSVGVYAAPQHRPLRDLDPATTGEEVDPGVSPFLDSLALFKTRMAPATPDPALPGFFPGRTFDIDVPDTDSSFTLDADTVGTWYGYQAPVNLVLEIGEEVDLVIPNEDTTLQIDSLGYSMIPVYVTATISVGAELGNFNLYYYTKTGPLPGPVDTSGNIDTDVGDMTYYPFEVKTGIINIGPKQHQNAKSRIDVVSLNSGHYRITVKSVSNPNNFHLEIYNVKGDLIQTFSNQASHQPKMVFHWDGTDISDQRVKAGIYLVHMKTGQGVISKKITVGG